jgi:3-deoxy-D-manno-octulosonic acid kinase
VAAGPEEECRDGRGAMIFDAARVTPAGPEIFDRGHWRSRGLLEEQVGGRGTVAFVRDGTRRWVLRHYRRGGLVARFADDAYCYGGAARTRAFAEWRLLRRLRDWALPVPVPVAARYVRSGLVYRADLITEELPTRLTLAAALASGPVDRGTWHGVGRCIGDLHRHGVRHADLNAHNLLLGEDGTVYVIDFDRGSVRRRGAWEGRVLDRLRRSLAKVTAGLPDGRFGDLQWQWLREGVAER